MNPKTVTWSALLDTIQNGLGGPDKVRIVPLAEWVEALECSAQENHGFLVESNPAIKLLGFWKIISEKSEQALTDKRLESNGHVNGESGLQNEAKVPDLQQNKSEKRKSWLKQCTSKLLSRKDTLDQTQQTTSNKPPTSDRVVEVESGLQDEFEVTDLLKDSSEASDLRAVSPDWMKVWLKQWAF